MDMRELTFGIEVETVGQTRQRVAQAIQSVVGGEVRHEGSTYDTWSTTDGEGRVWKVVRDASLSNVPDHLRAEVVSPILRYEDLEKLQQVVRAIRSAGARVDNTTAIHIHVGAAPFDGKALTRFAKLVYKQEPLIQHALGIQQGRMNQYAKPMNPDFIALLERTPPSTTAQMNTLWYGYQNTHPQHYDSTRYYV
jgi:hypothetical protein